MAKNERKRQKQLAAKKKKRQQKKPKGMTMMPVEGKFNLKSYEQAEKYPIRSCLVPDTLFENGIGNIIVARDLPTGDVAVGVFLADVFCLGIKDAFLRSLNLFEYKDFIDENPEGRYVEVAPAYAKKLIDDLLSYAETLGFRPHKDYKKAKYMFGNVNSSESNEVFEFGQEGKPHYMSGPYDSPQKIERIRKTLTKSCGEDGYNITIFLGGSSLDFEELEFLED